MPVSPAIAFLLAGGKLLAGAGAAAQIGEAVLPRLGVMDPGTKILKTGADIVLDVLGVPHGSDAPAIAGASAPASTPALGEAMSPAAPPVSSREIRICVECQGDTPVLAGTGSKVFLDRCETHREDLEGVVSGIDGLYLGWAEANGIDPEQAIGEIGAVGYCGPKPSKNEDKYRGVFGGLKEDKYFAALNKWQKCAAKQKRDTAAEKKSLKSAVKAQKDRDKAIAKTALDATRRRFTGQIQALRQAQAETKSQAEKDALQAQINQLTQQKHDADALNAKIQEQAKDDAHQRQIDDLKKEIANRAQQPGGMDEMFKMVMLQRAMQPNAPPAAQQAPAIMMLQPPAAPAAPVAPAQPQVIMMPGMPGIPGMPDMPSQSQVFMDESESDVGFEDLMGADDALVEEIEIADNLGLAGAVTNGDAMAFQNLRNAWSPEEYAEFTSGFNEISGCGNSIASCGLRPRE